MLCEDHEVVHSLGFNTPDMLKVRPWFVDQNGQGRHRDHLGISTPRKQEGLEKVRG